MSDLDHTHDPTARSWVESANDPATDFPIQNLPLGVFSLGGGDRHVGTAIGGEIVDLTVLEAEGLLLEAVPPGIFQATEINPLMAQGSAVWRSLRHRLFALLEASSGELRNNGDIRDRARVAQADATLHLPFFVRSYTDFYASREHATNVGTMFRGPDNALPPNWLHIPIGYNGRASSVVVSGTPVHRPWGQLKSPDEAAPRFAPCERFDIELEFGAVVGTATALGCPVTVAEADEMIFGYVLLNDWSARDIQTWEYQPLGPFQSKAAATTISPWVVTRDALAPFRAPTPERVTPLLPYLAEDGPGNFDIDLEITLTPEGGRAATISRTNYRQMYFSSAQQLAHHTASGCPMCTGDLLGSGTISGSAKGTYGSMLELSWGGKEPLELAGAQGSRTFLEDGDTVTFRGRCQSDGARAIGFGECAGTVLPARPYPGLGGARGESPS